MVLLGKVLCWSARKVEVFRQKKLFPNVQVLGSDCAEDTQGASDVRTATLFGIPHVQQGQGKLLDQMWSTDVCQVERDFVGSAVQYGP